MLKYIRDPAEMLVYTRNLYSSLHPMLPQRIGALHIFQFTVHGVFQGDTLSPLLFLIAFNPILHVVQNHPAQGFSLDSGGRAATSEL